jgi:hypothetical protein
MNDLNAVRVLLVSSSPQLFFICQQHLERNGCYCEFANCEQEVWVMLEQNQFDLVLAVHNTRGANTECLGGLLTGSRTSLFFALPVEQSCWWVPILRLGQDCFGAPALRPGEFTIALDEILKEIRADAA